MNERIKSKILAAMPGTRQRLALNTGLSLTTVHRYMQELHKAGLCHVAYYVPPRGAGGHPEAFYREGRGIDMLRPEPTPKALAAKRHRRNAKVRSMVTDKDAEGGIKLGGWTFRRGVEGTDEVLVCAPNGDPGGMHAKATAACLSERILYALGIAIIDAAGDKKP